MKRAAIVPLAGNSSRFYSRTSRPKWALDVGGKSILSWALDSLLGSRLEIQRFVFVIRSTHSDEFRKALTIEPSTRFDVVEVEATPNGQAESVAIALRSQGLSEEFVVWNGDTHLSKGWSDGLSLTGNWLVLSELEGDHWSFASTSGGLVTMTAEKKRISSAASVGLYSFASPDDFFVAYDEAPKESEVYIAPLYNSLIGRGVEVRPYLIPKTKFYPLGTPSEVLSSSLRMGLSAPSELLTEFSSD